MTDFLGTIYNYSDTGYNFTHAPYHPFLVIETSLAIYYVSEDDPTQLWKYTIATGSDAQVDVDPDDDSGDQKSRDRKIQACWLDRDNTIIYFADCDNDDVDTQFDTWKIDYSDDTVTDLDSTDPAGLLDIYVMDIFVSSGGDRYVITWNHPTGPSRTDIFKNGNDPSEDDFNGANASRGVLIGNLFYFVVDTSTTAPPWQAVMVAFDTTTDTIASATGLNNVQGTSTVALKGMSYDDDDTLYFILEDRADANANKLYSYSITGSSFTAIDIEYDICLMLDRLSNPSNSTLFNIEKAFDISLDSNNNAKIYKISTSRTNLYAISELSLSSGDLIVGVTDTYLIVDRSGSGGDVDVYEYVDFSSYVLGRSVIRAIQRNYWQCEMYIRTTGSLGDYNIFDGMFVQIIGNLSAQCNTGTLSYFGSPDNFNDETVGTQGTSIAFIDSATLYDGQAEIVSSWQSHKNVLRLLDDVTAGEDPTFTHNLTASTANTVEFYVGTDDVTELWLFGLYDSSVPDYIVKLRITASNLDYLDSLDAWQSVQAVANDTFYHVKIIWRADNTFDVYVDETIKVTNQATNNNQSSGVDQFIVTAEGDSTDYLYFDAWGDISDSDYYVGRNLIKTKENAILYEGYARFSDLKDPRKVWIDSPALRDLKNKIFPGSYSGNTDAILSDIFDDSFNYITAGTMSSGTAMGTVYFRGSKKGKRIIDNYAQIDSFTWVIKCDDGQGLLNYNDGSVNSHITITEVDKLGWQGGKKIRDIVNQVNLKGAINPDTGKPFESTYNNKASQKIYGIQPIFRTYAQIDDQTILDNLAQAIGTIAAQAPFQYKFSRKARFEGLNLPIETLNFAYSPESISASDRIIHSLEYYWRTGLIIYQIIDAL